MVGKYSSIKRRDKFVNNKTVLSIRSALIMIIPVLTAGSFALILKSLPITAYQNFIKTFYSGALLNFFNIGYNATFGALSVYMAISIGYAMTKETGFKTRNSLAAPMSSLIAFLISVGFATEDFTLASFSAIGMFTAIISSIIAAKMFMFFRKKLDNRRIYSDGADPKFNHAIVAIPPIALVCITFALINALIAMLTPSTNFFQLTSTAVGSLFEMLENNILGAFLYILLSSVLWFFGIHGSDVLETVNLKLFEPAVVENANAVLSGIEPKNIFSKTFFDVFVLIGGCGTLLALLIALMLFSKRKSNRLVAKLATLPMLFNVNEIMVFGLPIIFNPVLFIPFIITPITAFLISVLATSTGLVPLAAHEVEWTTPILIGGYQATGSIAGSILQFVNLIIGVLIYMPFVKMYDRKKGEETSENLEGLIELLKSSEKERYDITLTELGDIEGEIAKQLVYDLKYDIEKKKLFMFYQPQFDKNNVLIGVEALLRWNHSNFGMMYPPLVIKIAEESGMLETLEKYVFRQVKEDMSILNMPLKVSINATPQFLSSPGFTEFLKSEFSLASAGKAKVCIEITERSELITDEKMSAIFKTLKSYGFLLAIDDFSMGYTSLRYLSENNFDIVKIDGSLVRGLNNPRNRDIIASIVFLSKSLGFSVLAEFVETEEQRDILDNIGCYEYQGYLYSKPLSLMSLSDFINDNEIGNRNI